MNFEHLVTVGGSQLGIPDAWKIPVLDRAVARRARALEPSSAGTTHFAAWMNVQGVESATGPSSILPPAFYETFLGAHMHMGAALYNASAGSLFEAEHNALQTVCDEAGLAQGQEILDLGCGWGALTFLAAESYPQSHITAFTSSARQASYVQAQAAARGLTNITVLCTDINAFEPGILFDRVVCLSMLAQVANWRGLLTRARSWMKPNGRFLAQMPTHITTAYSTGAPGAGHTAMAVPGIMPSQGLIRHFSDLFTVEAEQHWSGTHMARTAMHWLENFDRNRAKASKLLRAAYGATAEAKRHEWRLFFLETSRMHAHAFGDVWGIGQYTLVPQQMAQTKANAVATSQPAMADYQFH